MRDVDPVALGVFFQVAQDVGELQGDAHVNGVLPRDGVSIAEYLDANKSDDGRDLVAVGPQLGEVGEAGFSQVGLDAVDHLFKVAYRNVECASGVAEGEELGGRSGRLIR